jgi:hypothetical protein
MLKKLIILITILAFSSVSYAETLSTKLQNCAKIQNSLSRLSCFDDLSIAYKNNKDLAVNISTVNTPLKSTNPISTVKTQAEKESDFGGEKIKKKQLLESGNTLEAVIYTILNIRKNAYKELTITFDNGQVWKQTDNRRLRLRVGDEVEISTAMLGTFLLKKVNAKKTIRVKRLK